MNQPVVRIRRIIKAERKKVFEAWTKPELMRNWFFVAPNWSASVSNELKVGGSYKIEMHSEEKNTFTQYGEYKEIKPPEKLVFTWNSSMIQNSLVTIEFKELGDTTELTLTHELLPTEDIRNKHEGGWNGCLDSLEKYLK